MYGLLYEIEGVLRLAFTKDADGFKRITAAKEESTLYTIFSNIIDLAKNDKESAIEIIDLLGPKSIDMGENTDKIAKCFTENASEMEIVNREVGLKFTIISVEMKDEVRELIVEDMCPVLKMMASAKTQEIN